MTLPLGIKIYIETLIEKEKVLRQTMADIKAEKDACPVALLPLKNYDNDIDAEYREYLATMQIRCDLERILEENGYRRKHTIDATVTTPLKEIEHV